MVGTLSGAVVGAAAGLAGQWLKWRQDRATRWDASRKDSYSGFLADCEQCFEALWQVAYTISHRHHGDIGERWRTANPRYEAVRTQHDVVVLLAGPATAGAADELLAWLADLQSEVYVKAKQSDATFATQDEYRQSYEPLRRAFIDAARRELDIGKPGARTDRDAAGVRPPRRP